PPARPTVAPDLPIDLDSTFVVALQNASPLIAIVPSHGTATETFALSVPDAPPFFDNVSQNEGNVGTTPFTFTISLSAPTFQPVTVDYATASGGAHPATAGSRCNGGTDYLSQSGTATIPANQTSTPATGTLCPHLTH